MVSHPQSLPAVFVPVDGRSVAGPRIRETLTMGGPYLRPVVKHRSRQSRRIQEGKWQIFKIGFIRAPERRVIFLVLPYSSPRELIALAKKSGGAAKYYPAAVLNWYWDYAPVWRRLWV